MNYPSSGPGPTVTGTNPPSSGATPSVTGTNPPDAQGSEGIQQVADRAHDLAGTAQVKIRDQIDTRSTQAGEQVSATAMALRSGAEELYRQGNESAGDAAQRAAAQAERLGSYLQAADADQILSDVEDIARRNPWAVAAGGVVAGIAAARFLKASSARRSPGSRYGGGYAPSSNGGSQ
jgi:hypothetical protein